jgi:hypothetical protein
VDAALGFKPRTGRAVMVLLARDADGDRVLERAEVPLLPPGEFAPYHAAEGMEPRAAGRHVKRAIAAARRMARAVVRGAMRRCKAAGHTLRGCGVQVGSGTPPWTTAEILAVHIRMHKVEGEMFRGILVDAAEACGLRVTTLPSKAPLDAAAKVLRKPRARLDAQLAALGKAVGPPWGGHEKEAAAAALAVLA